MNIIELSEKIKYKGILERYNYDWNLISKHEYLSEEFIEFYKDNVN